MRPVYPFSAVAGQDDVKLALLLVAVDPGIGGVLIRGERGTAKSTIARGLAALLPECLPDKPAPFVELPLGATEDRVVGSLDISQVLRDGATQLRSGLLAHADGGVLYVDEVNLLPDHLVDLLLDAAASGWVTVERDGVSAGEAARFVLIGTMNPEEGDLRPQFLDRFGLSVQVAGLANQDLRMAALERRLSFDQDPAAFVAQSEAEQAQLRRAIVDARMRLPTLPITNVHLSKVTEISAQHRLDGMRGDLAIIKAARALAAWQSAPRIEAEHIRLAAEFALPHRSRRKATQPRRPNEYAPQSETGGAGADAATPPAQEPLQPAPAAPGTGTVKLFTDLIDRNSIGRRGSQSVAPHRGIRAFPFEESGTLAINETLTAASGRGARVGDGGVVLTSADLMRRERRGPGHSSVLFLVDASSSMAMRRRLELAKGAALGLLRSSYQRRDQVALMVFRGVGTDVVLPFTDQVNRIESALDEVPSGGRTPLARALLDAAQLAQTRDPALVVIFTDGRANVGVSTDDPWQDALTACGALKAACAGALVIDCEAGPILLGRAQLLAETLQAECVALSALDGTDLTVRISRRLELL